MHVVFVSNSITFKAAISPVKCKVPNNVIITTSLQLFANIWQKSSSFPSNFTVLMKKSYILLKIIKKLLVHIRMQINCEQPLSENPE